MGENTRIEWADHTFNPWFGCQKVSPACDFCYAERWAARSGLVEWGPHAERRLASDTSWAKPIKWNARAAKLGVRFRVFCASLADVFDNKVPREWRHRLWQLIKATPHLDWLLLTKRPQNIPDMLPEDWGEHGYPNVWLGTTVEMQPEGNLRISHLLAVPAPIHFLSCEPSLGDVDLRTIISRDGILGPFVPFNALRSRSYVTGRAVPRIDWVIAGGESGPGARPSHPDWFRSLRDQCQDHGVAFFFKQWGDWVEVDGPHCAAVSTERDPSDCWIEPDGQVHARAEHKGRFSAYSTSIVRRVGKKKAGRLLDGRIWDELPHPSIAATGTPT